MNDYSFDNLRRIGDPTRSRSALRTLLIATVVSVVLWFIPYADVLTYPIRLMVTFLHEGGHAFTALVTGGSVDQIQVYSDGSGVTQIRGGLGFLTASAGYLGATLYGALLISLVRRGTPGRTLLLATGIAVALLTVIFVRPWLNIFGFAWGAAIAAALVLGARRLSAPAANWTAAFLGVQCALNALYDLRTLFDLSWNHSGAHTDAVLMSQYLLLPPVVWSALWIALSLVILWIVLRPARRTTEG